MQISCSNIQHNATELLKQQHKTKQLKYAVWTMSGSLKQIYNTYNTTLNFTVMYKHSEFYQYIFTY